MVVFTAKIQDMIISNLKIILCLKVKILILLQKNEFTLLITDTVLEVMIHSLSILLQQINNKDVNKLNIFKLCLYVLKANWIQVEWYKSKKKTKKLKTKNVELKK
jgi:hypothetical protein